MSVGVSAAFTMRCVECDGSDSGTATGDGNSTVGTTNGTARFQGGVPSFASLALKHSKDLRFVLKIAPYPANPSSTDCPPGLPGGFGPCDYSAMNVQRVRFFVVALAPTVPDVPADPSLYCTQVPSPCASIASVRFGETFSGDQAQTVIYSTELVGQSGMQLDLDESTNLQLTNEQWQALDLAVKAVQRYDTNNPQFFVGFSVRVNAVDPDPGDGVTTKIVPFAEILTIDTLNSKAN